MGWNSPSNKAAMSAQIKSVPMGAPISTNPGNVGRGYKDGWDIERVYRDGVKKVTWVYRCIDTIAGNVARLPMQGHKDNKPGGEIVADAEVLDLLNRRSNPGEDSFAFRYRLSAQLLTSTRGAFVEIIRGKGGQPIALHLLPPQYTAPIPDPKKYVSGFEVMIPSMDKQILRPEDVLWFKHPHPLDPYLSMTPMESAGVAIEIENLAKYYNRNFLLNDGRPGGLVVVRGEMEEDDKDELRARFRGGVGRAGAVSVIASEEGVDFVDTSASPRDASYIQMRQITKEEILAAFGVPESVTGNASGRTFSNASEELRVFWLETIPPHLEMIARGMDALDDKLYFDFDTSNVPILIMAKQERQRYVMDEFQQGLATANEYREASGRKAVDSELADSMLANPNLTPIGNTKKKTEMPAPPGAPPEGGAPPEAGPLPEAGPPPEAAPPPEASPPPEAGASPSSGEVPDQGVAPKSADDMFSDNATRYKNASDGVETKLAEEWSTKAAISTDRWTETLDRGLERFFERQQRVVTEKALGAKSRKALASGTLGTAAIFDTELWNRQMVEDFRPVIAGIMVEASALYSPDSDHKIDIDDPDIKEYLDVQMERMQKVNNTTFSEIDKGIKAALTNEGDTEDDRHLLIKAAVLSTFVRLVRHRRADIAEHEAQTAFNAGTYFSEMSRPSDQRKHGLHKVWASHHDGRVRPAHAALDGTSVPFGKAFTALGHDLRFPGDPLAPLNLTMGCRCRLKWRVS